MHTELALTAIELATTASADALAAAALTPESLRAGLQHHLNVSALYDVRHVLAAVRGGALALEQVIMYRKVCVAFCNHWRHTIQCLPPFFFLQLGEHAAALRILALQLDDLDAAERYCRQHAGQDGYAVLMDMLLAPGQGHEPRLEQACRLLTAQGTLRQLCTWMTSNRTKKMQKKNVLKKRKYSLNHIHKHISSHRRTAGPTARAARAAR